MLWMNLRQNINAQSRFCTEQQLSEQVTPRQNCYIADTVHLMWLLAQHHLPQFCKPVCLQTSDPYLLQQQLICLAWRDQQHIHRITLTIPNTERCKSTQARAYTCNNNTASTNVAATS